MQRPDPRTTSVIAGTRLDLLEAMETLERDHPQFVEPLLLRDVYGLPYEEIAQLDRRAARHDQGADPPRPQAGAADAGGVLMRRAWSTGWRRGAAPAALVAGCRDDAAGRDGRRPPIARAGSDATPSASASLPGETEPARRRRPGPRPA